MDKLDGCDERGLFLEDDKLTALRWGAEQTSVPLVLLTPGKVIRHDKGKLLGVFGSKEQRVRTDFDRIDIAIWVPLEREAEAEAFVAKVNAAIDAARASG